MTNILHTSKLIKQNYEEEVSSDSDFELSYDEYVPIEFKRCYEFYRYNKHISIDMIQKHIAIFEQMNLHDSFMKPVLDEYFNPTLNHLLVTDFIISFLKAGYPGSEIKNITFIQIFDIFVNLSYYYDFMNYIDVDVKLIDYIKYMLVLFLLRVNRETIEKYFAHVMWNLDDFFRHEVFSKVFTMFASESFVEGYDNFSYGKSSRHTGSYEYSLKAKIESKFSKVLKEIDETIDYTSEEYKFLDSYFRHDKNPYFSENSTLDNSTLDKFIFPQYSDTRNTDYVGKISRENNGGWHDDYDDDDDDYDDDYSVYEYDKYGYRIDKFGNSEFIRTYQCSLDDPKYTEYQKMYLFRLYKKLVNDTQHLTTFLNKVKNNIVIKDYKALHQYEVKAYTDNRMNDDILKNQILTYFGEILPDYSMYNKKQKNFNMLFNIAYELAHLNIIKHLVNNCGYNMDNDDKIRIKMDIDKVEINNFLKNNFPKCSFKFDNVTSHIHMK